MNDFDRQVLGERLDELIENSVYTDTQVANLLDVTKSAVGKWRTGKSEPKATNIAKLANILGLTVEDFMMPRGSIISKNVPNGTELVDIDYKMDGMMPVLSSVQAGDFGEVMPVTINDAEEWIPRPSHLSERAFGVYVKGRSMYPEFKPGEIVHVEPEITVNELRDGDLVIVSLNSTGESTFKQLVLGETSKDIYLKPLNPEWINQKIIPMEECTLVGVIDGKYTRYR